MRHESRRTYPFAWLILMLAGAILAACGTGADTRASEIDGKEMVRVPAGSFLMGTDPEERDAAVEEQPQHEVTLEAFWIDMTETTNAEYARCVAAGACQAPEKSDSYTRPAYYGDDAFDAYPVIWVTWDDAKTYCEWAAANACPRRRNGKRRRAASNHAATPGVTTGPMAGW